MHTQRHEVVPSSRIPSGRASSRRKIKPSQVAQPQLRDRALSGFVVAVDAGWVGGWVGGGIAGKCHQKNNGRWARAAARRTESITQAPHREAPAQLQQGRSSGALEAPKQPPGALLGLSSCKSVANQLQTQLQTSRVLCFLVKSSTKPTRKTILLIIFRKGKILLLCACSPEILGLRCTREVCNWVCN